MKRPGSRVAIITVLVLGLLIFGGVVYAWNTASAIFQPISSSTKTVLLEIKPNETTAEIADDLQNKGLIRNAVAFRVWARIKGLDTKLQAGIYNQLSPNMTISEMTDKLLNGQPDQVPVLVLEGWRLEQIANIFSQTQQLAKFKKADFLNYVKNINSFPDKDKYPILQDVPGGDSMEGLLFPATYEVPVESTARDVVNLLLKQMNDTITQNNLDKLAQQHQYKNTYQFIKMASIVERETGDKAYRDQIASIYWNRAFKTGLETVGKLQADPTVEYARDTQNPPTRYWAPLADNPGNITPDSLWNTYTKQGFPPTPICSPGLASLKAAANPPVSDNLYFFAAKDGKTYFAKTLAEITTLQQQHPVNN